MKNGPRLAKAQAGLDLGSHHDSFLDAMVASGRYASRLDVLRCAVRLLEEAETQHLAMRHAMEADAAEGSRMPSMAELERAARRTAGLPTP